MIETILILLLYVVLIAIVIKVVLIVLARVGFVVGSQIEGLVWLAFAILVLIWIARIVLAGGGIPYS